MRTIICGIRREIEEVFDRLAVLAPPDPRYPGFSRGAPAGR
jgi:hypothetical protein